MSFDSDLKPSEDPDEIFKAVTEGKMLFLNLTKLIQIVVNLYRSSDMISCLHVQVMRTHWTDWQCNQRLCPELMIEGGFPCMRLPCSRIKGYWRLYSQVVKLYDCNISSYRLLFLNSVC